MNQPIRRRMARAVSTAVMVVFLASIWSAPGVATSEADEGVVAVELTRVEPAAPQPGDTVTLSGTVTNLGDEPLENVQALFRYHSRPVQSRSEISRIPDDPRLYWGWRPGHIFDAVARTLAPHESARFRLEMTLDTHCAGPTLEEGLEETPCLALPSAGVYAVGVDVNLTPAGGARTTAATARTLLPWNITADPIDVALLWPIAATPMASDRDDDESAGADGGLHTLIEAAAGRPVSWAVDPDFATSACGNGECALREALDDAGDVIVLPASVPDIGSLAGIDADVAADVAAQSALVQRQFLAATPEMRSARSNVSWLDNGTVSEAAANIWSDAGYSTTVLPAEALAAPVHGALARLDDDQVAILTDTGLGSAITDAVSDGSTLQLRQRWLAETAMAAGEDVESGRALAAAPPLGWQPSSDVVSAVLDVWTETSWINPVGFGEFDDEALPAAVLDSTGGPDGGLPADYARSIITVHYEIQQYRDLLAEPDEPSDLLTTAQAASMTWQYDVETGKNAVSEMRTTVSSALDDVTVVVNPMNTLSSNTGVFPVNIANNLHHAVDVRVDFDPENRDRMSISPIEAQRVEAGEQVTVQVRAEAVANGQVPVDIQLATLDGSPLGGAQRTIINATQYGTIGWFVVGGSALLFAGGLSWRMVRGRRRNNGAEPDASDAFAKLGGDGDMVSR